METLLHVNLSHQAALERRMDVIANNMANMSTTAYKGESVLFENYIERIGGEGGRALNEVNYLLDFGTIRAREDGAFQITQNPFDIALQGEGYFTVQSDNGEALYTRRGHLFVDPDGFLALRGSGERLLDTNGQTIPINLEDGLPAISEDGSITGDQGPIAQLALVRFDDERALLRQGANLFRSTNQAPQPAESLEILQGGVEGSNINPIIETTKMVEVMRAYQSAQKSLDDTDELRQRAIDRLARIN